MFKISILDSSLLIYKKNLSQKMRYLLKRNEFLLEKNIKVENIDIKRDFKSSALIRETFENDLSWGGSLIGRLINSTLRVLKIYVKTARITFVIPQLRRALDDLLTVCRTNEEQRAQLDNLTSQFLLDEIINVVNSSDSVEQKVAQLLGADNDTNPGLVRSTIIRIEKIEGFEDKDEVITKLEAFLEALRRIKEELGDLPETEDEDGEDGDGEDGEGQGESESGEGKSLSTQFQFSTITLFKALIAINLVFKNKRVSLEGDKSAPVLSKSKKVLYTDPKGRQMKAVVLSVDHPITNPGTDKIFLTDDDVIDSTKSIKPKVLIAIRNPKTGKIDMTAKRVLVDATTLKNESVIFENAAEIKENEIHAKAAWKKIQKEYVASNLASQVPLMEKLMEMRQQSDKSVSGIMKALMKQVFENEKTEGKIISFQDLIKENVNILQTDFKTLPKTISLMARVIMSFKEDMGLLQSMGEAQKPLKSFIESYTKLKEILPKLSEEKPKEKPVKKKEEPKKNESFRLFEADEPEDEDPQGQSQDDPQDEPEGGDDDVKTAWREQFTEEEEKKYKIDEKGARELQNAVSGEKAATIDVSDPAQYDRILEITKIFGRAYKMYAVDVIPSGRPEGRISQKTFREYEYIGKEDSSRPDWKEDETPGYGPWAVRATYEKWQDGVMDILQDTKYRKILANSKFKNAGPNQEEGSGLTLFTFINDMLNEGGEYGTFRQRRHVLLNKYFGADSGGIEQNSGPAETNDNPTISPDDMGTPGEVSFVIPSKNSLTIADFRKDAKISYSKTFFKVKVKGTEIRSYIIFINGIPKPSDVGGKTVLAIKMHRNDPSKIKQSLITSYMDDYFTGEDALKLDKNITNNPNELVYVGIIEFEKADSKIFQKNGKMKIKYLKSELLNSADPTTEEFTVLDVGILGYSDKKKKTNVPLIRKGAPKSRPTNDKVSDLIEKLKNDKIKKKFGLVKK